MSLCESCGLNEATCVGRYEVSTGPWSLACDACCGHGNEDGRCFEVIDADIKNLINHLEAREAEVRYLRAWKLWARRELDRNEIRGELIDDPEPTPSKGVEP